MTEQEKTRAQAAAFQRLVAHLQERSDVQNIDLMNLSGFCRNCLSRWFQEALGQQGVELSKMDAREMIYGMRYETWKNRHQKP